MSFIVNQSHYLKLRKQVSILRQKNKELKEEILYLKACNQSRQQEIGVLNEKIDKYRDYLDDIGAFEDEDEDKDMN